MARIAYTPLIEEIVGKMAGSVFQDSYGGYQVRTRVSPANPQTQYQQLRRGMFAYLSAGWRNLSAPDRATWIAEAGTAPAALRLYLQANINLTLIEVPTITAWAAAAIPDSMTVSFVSATPSLMEIIATGAITVVPADTMLLVQITYQKVLNRIFTNPSQFSPVIAFDEGTDLSAATDIITEWQARYGQFVAGKRICLKANLISKINGNRGADYAECIPPAGINTFRVIDSNADPLIDSDGTFITFQ